jgi:hypothetical protein
MLKKFYGRRCPYCHTKLSGNSLRCLRCGTRLAAPFGKVLHIKPETLVIAPTPELTRANQPAAEAAPTIQPQNVQSTRPKGRGFPWLFLLLVYAGFLLVFLGVSSGVLAYFIARDYLVPPTTLSFEPDYTQVSRRLDTLVLEDTAQALTNRAHHLGYSQIMFVVKDKYHISSQVPGYINLKDLINKIKAVDLLEFVDFDKTPLDEGARIKTDLENKYLHQSDEKTWHTIMTNSGIRSASFIKNKKGEFKIDLHLTASGQKKIAEYTATHLDSYLGIVLDKVIISCPKVAAPILDGRVLLTGSFTEKTASELVNKLQKTDPLPIPIRLVQKPASPK